MSARIDAAKSAADKYASMVLHYSHNAEKYGNYLQKYSRLNHLFFVGFRHSGMPTITAHSTSCTVQTTTITTIMIT